jgi:hypothetical protein
MTNRTRDPAARDAVVNGVDVDAVAAAVESCPGVEQLRGGPPQWTATYLPGRRVEGVRTERRIVVVQVRARWGVPAADLAAQIRGAIAPLAAGRRIEIVLADVRSGAGRRHGCMDENALRRREFIRAHHPDRGGDPATFVAGLAKFDRGEPDGGAGQVRVVVVTRPAMAVRVARAVGAAVRAWLRGRRPHPPRVR